MRTPVDGRILGGFLCLLLVLLLGCQGSGADGRHVRDRKLIDAPRVGDLYAAELTYFSEASFEGKSTVYGLMKVLEVQDDDITLVTEDAGSDDISLSLQDLEAGSGTVKFDEREQIVIHRSDLREAFESGKIYAVRRPEQ